MPDEDDIIIKKNGGGEPVQGFSQDWREGDLDADPERPAQGWEREPKEVQGEGKPRPKSSAGGSPSKPPPVDDATDEDPPDSDDRELGPDQSRR